MGCLRTNQILVLYKYEKSRISLTNHRCTCVQDPEILKEVEEWRVPLITYTNIKIGESYVVLKGDKQHCRSEECNLGK